MYNGKYISNKNCISRPGKSYAIHPEFNLYAGCEDGNIIHIIQRKPTRGTDNKKGYLNVNVRKHGDSNQKKYYSHHFIWECYNSLIGDDCQS